MRLIDADALNSVLEIEQYNDYDDLLRTERLIDNAPTIKAFTLADIEEQYRKGLEKGLEERPHGEWKQVTAKDGEYYCYHKCTNCGQTIESGFDNPPIFNFCPNCGADMRKERGDAE